MRRSADEHFELRGVKNYECFLLENGSYDIPTSFLIKLLNQLGVYKLVNHSDYQELVFRLFYVSEIIFEKYLLSDELFRFRYLNYPHHIKEKMNLFQKWKECEESGVEYVLDINFLVALRGLKINTKGTKLRDAFLKEDGIGYSFKAMSIWNGFSDFRIFTTCYNPRTDIVNALKEDLKEAHYQNAERFTRLVLNRITL